MFFSCLSIALVDANSPAGESRTRISGIVNFVNGNLRPVKSDVDGDLSLWYKQNSRVYVEQGHACFSSPQYEKKVQKKRFGTVIRSAYTGLSRMMRGEAEAAQQFILSRVSDSGHGETTEEDKMA